MSQWKFGNFETEIDFTDVDFLDRIDEGKQLMQEAEKNVLKVGKNSDIIRSQCEVFYIFFDHVFGRDAREAMFEGKTSLMLCVKASESLSAFEHKEAERIGSTYGKYEVQNHGNRQQRRAYNSRTGGRGVSNAYSLQRVSRKRDGVRQKLRNRNGLSGMD